MKNVKAIVLGVAVLIGSIGIIGSSAASNVKKDGAKEISEALDVGYYVIQEGVNKRMKFTRRVNVIVHTSPQYAPYAKTVGHSKNDILVKPGQWGHVQLSNGKWAYAQDADNR